MLAVGGEGIGADLIKHTLEVNGEGGIVFKTTDMNRFKNHVQDKGYHDVSALNFETNEKEHG